MASNLTITFTIDPSLAAIQNTNATLYNALVTAASTADTYFMQHYSTTNPLTLTYALTINQTGVASSSTNTYNTTYSSFYQAIQATDNAATSNATQKAAAASLPQTDPTGAPANTSNIQLTAFDALALGLNTGITPGCMVTFNSTINWLDPSNGTIASDAYDAVGTMEHEVSELMGRSANAGYDGDLAAGAAGNLNGSYTPLDFYRFTATGARAEPFAAGYNPATATYFAVNAASVAGAQSLQMEDYPNWLPAASGVQGAAGADVVDWSSNNVSGDPFGSTTNGQVMAVSAADVALLNVLGYQSVACFAAGTQIALADGTSRAVENLKVGDRVLSALGEPQNIAWIGSRYINCAAHPKPENVWPVRIRPGAFGNGAPRTELLLSPDHAVFVDGVLVPIRLLANGGTIARFPVPAVTYYHVELPQHDVILAEGLPAESYLDTGNRGMFQNADEPLTLYPNLTEKNDQARRESESCAPLVCDPAGVEPIWRRLAAHATALGCPREVEETTAEPALCIVTGGKCHAPVAIVGGRYSFVVPRLHGDARLVSRSAVPSAASPWIDDRRQLGVLVQRLVVRSATHRTEIAMDNPRLTEGWWQPEHNHTASWRWTNGNAVLPVTGDGMVVEVWVGATQSYAVTENHRERSRVAA